MSFASKEKGPVGPIIEEKVEQVGDQDLIMNANGERVPRKEIIGAVIEKLPPDVVVKGLIAGGLVALEGIGKGLGKWVDFWDDPTGITKQPLWRSKERKAQEAEESQRAEAEHKAQGGFFGIAAKKFLDRYAVLSQGQEAIDQHLPEGLKIRDLLHEKMKKRTEATS